MVKTYLHLKNARKTEFAPRHFALAIILAAPAAMLAQGNLDSPRIGCLLDTRGEVRTVWGLRANFVLGEVATSGAVSTACSDAFGLVKTGDALLVMDRTGAVLHRREVVSGAATLGFDEQGRPAFAHLRSTGETLRWDGSQWNTWNVSLEAAPLAITAEGDHLLALVRRHDELCLLRLSADGETALLVRMVSSAGQAVIYPGGLLVLAEEHSLLIRYPDGRQQRLDVPVPVLSLHAMSSRWVSLQSEAQTMGLLLTGEQAELHLIPGAGN
ncbi:MAG: hypothetical protein JJE04_24255 [Acidobacteriia bacterium]|nr:hypothetical protein [Terriglobia bacterium]